MQKVNRLIFLQMFFVSV